MAITHFWIMVWECKTLLTQSYIDVNIFHNIATCFFFFIDEFISFPAGHIKLKARP